MTLPPPAPAFLAALVCVAWAALAPAASRDTGAAMGPIAPTVTVTMGDVGGKYFGSAPDPKRTRHYFIAAEASPWDFAPEVSDAICGKPLPPSAPKNHQLVTKTRYLEYQDATFTAKVPPTP